MKYSTLFGPVPSRRLGISLGIDLVPYKTCSLNCIYCEVGRTTNLTTKREEYVSKEKIIFELDDFLKNNPELDYITFSGQGEPTLNSKIGEIIDYIKSNYPQYKLALLTNGTLFYKKKLIKEVLKCDLILPSLDSATKIGFKKINQPAEDLKLANILRGLVDLRKNYKGNIWLEIFVIPGINDSKEELKSLKKYIKKIDPEQIQLNSLDRPGLESWIRKATLNEMEKIKKYLSEFNVKIIANFQKRKKVKSYNENIENRILSMTKRRPCTKEDMLNTFDINVNELNKYLGYLEENNLIKKHRADRGIFYKSNKNSK